MKTTLDAAMTGRIGETRVRCTIVLELPLEMTTARAAETLSVLRCALSELARTLGGHLELEES